MLQCGADGLAGDPMASFNLTHKAYCDCLAELLPWHLPILMLGGGREAGDDCCYYYDNIIMTYVIVDYYYNNIIIITFIIVG